MIKSISIKNYKLFENLSIDKISPFTLIGGKNNTGKSTLMEAMSMLFARSNPSIITDYLTKGGIYNMPKPSELIADFMFNYDGIPEFLCNSFFNKISSSLEATIFSYIAIDKNLIGTTLRIGEQNKSDFPSQYKFNNAKYKDIYIVYKDEVDGQEKDEEGTFFPPMPIELNINIGFIHACRQFNQQEEVLKIDSLKINGKVHLLLDLIRIILPTIQEIYTATIHGISMIYIQIGEEKQNIPLSYMGDGVTRLVSIIATMCLCENGVLFIDEIENGLHYSVIKDLWAGIIRAGKALNCQVIATTHSDEFLRLAYKAMKNPELKIDKNDFSYIKLEKDENNKIYVGALDIELFDYAIEENMEIR